MNNTKRGRRIAANDRHGARHPAADRHVVGAQVCAERGEHSRAGAAVKFRQVELDTANAK